LENSNVKHTNMNDTGCTNISYLKEGGVPAFETIFKTWYRGLCLFALRYIDDYKVSEEIVQDVFLRLWEKKDTLSIRKSIKSYLFQAVRNACIDYIRHQKVEQGYISEQKNQISEMLDNSETQLLEEDRIKKIMDTIENMPHKRKQIFRLNRFENLKYKEIADKLNISVKTVEAHMGKALQQLRKLAG
jgi:RNA polymerase sigma-70 factor, ECF subfamily